MVIIFQPFFRDQYSKWLESSHRWRHISLTVTKAPGKSDVFNSISSTIAAKIVMAKINLHHIPRRKKKCSQFFRAEQETTILHCFESHPVKHVSLNTDEKQTSNKSKVRRAETWIVIKLGNEKATSKAKRWGREGDGNLARDEFKTNSRGRGACFFSHFPPSLRIHFTGSTSVHVKYSGFSCV